MYLKVVEFLPDVDNFLLRLEYSERVENSESVEKFESVENFDHFALQKNSFDKYLHNL